jgi:hypothetical protein
MGCVSCDKLQRKSVSKRHTAPVGIINGRTGYVMLQVAGRVLNAEETLEHFLL